MYIKSIVLDGFKSYGNRVEITGFDPEFNAITGLNGTGKSNILDSICFVLGITNLSNVRAGSLQELIYKHGQAGITKATVSITFDNKDKRHCPIGYENHDEITVTRQVVMGGKNKYLINGINVQNKRVSDLFCSVQLNVNNPHFLIMQGRITKVLNMKPPEILSMVEEAAGTRMYEAKKQAAEKTIEKKDAKLRELDDIIKEDIAPKLQKLQDERAQFQEYQKVVREYENLSRLYIAWKYVTEQENAKEAESKVTGVQDEIKSKKDTIKENEVQAKEFDKEITKLNKKMDKESGNTLKQLEGDLGEAEQKEAKVAAEARAARDALATHDKRARLLHRALADDRRALAACRARLEGVSESFEQLRTSREAQQVALDEAQKHFLAVSSGLDSGSGSLHDQFIAAKQEASEASTCMSQCDMERRHAEARLKELEREFKSSSAQYERDQRTIASHEQQLAQLEAELSAMNFSEERYSELSEQVRAMQRAARGRRERAEALGARLQRCDFHYSDPEPGFDRSRVLGTICRLIDVCDPKYFTAIETAAGGRLYNVVVDTEQTSKLLLQRGQLRARTTIIPLNKISPSVVPPDVVRAAQDIGGGADKVRLALELVRFPARARAAVAWVLGGTLACADLDAARRATFDPRVRRRCVTLDGDVCDPAGTLSGGARHQGESVLQQLQQLKQLEAELQRDEEQLAAASAELEGMHQMADRYAAAKQKHETMRQEVEMTRLRVGSTRHAQAHAEMAALRDQLAALAERRARAARAQAEAAARAASLEGQLQDLQGHRDREFKKAEQALKKAKAECEQHGSEWKQREQEYEMLRLELQELEETVGGAERQLADSGAAGERLRAALHAAAEDHAKAAEEVKEIQARIKQYKAEIAEQNGSIARLVQKKEQLATANSELELQIKELEYKVKELQTEATECTKKIASLESEHPWISAEREYFGAAGGAYDFARQPGGASGASVAGARLAQLRERRERLSRGLNARAHALLGREEEQYADVLRKRAIVEADRAKLVQVIAELDERKRHTLRGACEQVNRDFGSIFGALLPGAQAQLAAAGAGAGAGTGSVLDGLEIRVGFNGAWKEALGELSGGQRSLVALSLVLALLLFKPAPLYILDEVDAALDLSHTQNIGQMLKDHFRHSQFIIVSLKDGMFNNANVLFRTRFVDGMSSVQRVSNARR